ncbi:hypothetical protein X975_14705, partial [Stegodyphus mimosarum]
MLKDNIRRQCLTITSDMLCSAVRNINPRLQLLLRNDVEHIEHFLNESLFQLCRDDHRRRVWRLPEQRANPNFTIASHTGPQPGVMVYGAISLDTLTPLVVIKGTLIPQRYVDDILRPVLLQFFLQYNGLIFQQDNVIPHTAHVAMNCLTACQTLPWPGRSACLGYDGKRNASTREC